MSTLKVNTIQETDGSNFHGFWNYGTAFNYNATGVSTQTPTFTGWDVAKVQHIRISWVNLSRDDNNHLSFRVGTSGTFSNAVSSGYTNTSGSFGISNQSQGDRNGNRIMFYQVSSNNLAYDGQLDLYRFSDSIFRFQGYTTPRTDDYLYLTNGQVPVSSMSHIFAYSESGNSLTGNFDSGQWKLDYLEAD